MFGKWFGNVARNNIYSIKGYQVQLFSNFRMFFSFHQFDLLISTSFFTGQINQNLI